MNTYVDLRTEPFADDPSKSNGPGFTLTTKPALSGPGKARGSSAETANGYRMACVRSDYLTTRSPLDLCICLQGGILIRCFASNSLATADNSNALAACTAPGFEYPWWR